MKWTSIKIVICGSFVDIYRYPDGPLFYEKTPKERIHSSVLKKEPKEETRKRSMRRSKQMVCWLVNANAHQYLKSDNKPYPPVMVTHTFKEDVRDISLATYHFSNGIKRLNYFITHSKNSHLRYLTVIEFQDKNRNGVVHFHTAFFNMPFIKTRILSDIWSHGIVDARIKRAGRIKNLGSYLSKYMSKNFNDDRLDGKKRYFSSRNLIKPIFIRDQKVALSLLQYIPDTAFLGKNEYENKYQEGEKIIHERYHLSSSSQLLEAYNHHVQH